MSALNTCRFLQDCYLEIFAKYPLFLISPNSRSPNPGCQLFFVTNSPFFLPGYPIIGHPGCLLGGNGRNYPVGGFQQVQTLRLQMALRTHFAQTKIGCPSIAEFRPKALFDHITVSKNVGDASFALPSASGCGGLCT